MKSRKMSRTQNERGMSLVEIMMGIMLMSVVLLGLAGAAGLAARQVLRGRVDMRQWAAVQGKVDSLMSVGAASVSSGSDVVNGQDIYWTVSGTNPRRIDIVAERLNVTARATAADTIVLYLTNPS